jgi:HTH-type transcriptional regulator/antitoxin HigA
MASVKEEAATLSRFPYNELAKRGYVEQTTNKEKRVGNLWKFFGVNSLSFVSITEDAAFRKSRDSNVKSEAIAAWLRCGELEAKKIEVPAYSESKLKLVLGEIKSLSLNGAEEFSKEIEKRLNEVGVALIYISHFRGTGVSGAVRWLNNIPVIQLSLYYAWADIFWFSLYHELGHLVLHGRKDKFIEFDKKELSPVKDKEADADRFASDALIPPKNYNEFLKNSDFSRSRIIKFAETLNVHPGVVAGRLSHDKKIDWKFASSLRTRLKLVSN